MNWKTEWKPLAIIAGAFALCYYLPVGTARFDQAALESLSLVNWYAREHVLLCLVPAFFIAGAIGAFVNQTSVMKYLGPKANKVVAYGVASVSGTILAVCSCTVLPLFAGIYRMGAGLGPAVAFLYAGPAINALAIILTARILGLELGIARAVGAIVFSVVIGLLTHLIYIREERAKVATMANMPEPELERPLWQTALYFAALVAILIFATWGKPDTNSGLYAAVYIVKWKLTAMAAVALGIMLTSWFKIKFSYILMGAIPSFILAIVFPSAPALAFTAGVISLSIVLALSGGEARYWLESSWSFAKQILPLLFIGVLIAGFLLGAPGPDGGNGIVPSTWIASMVGGNSLGANLFASVAGAFMYFATLTEVPILQGLLDNGMGKGPALALLLAGPALSLPNMLVIRSVMGTKKTLTYVILVVVMATISGYFYGMFFN